MNIAEFLLHSIYLLQIIYIIIPISKTISLFVLTVFIFFLAIIVFFQNKQYIKWTFKSLQSSGLLFLSYYLFTIILGFAYNYDFKYVAVNIFLLVPMFYFVLIPVNIDTKSILNIVLFYCFIALAFSYVELFAWDNIGFLHDYVNNSINEKGHSAIYSYQKGIKPFGISSNAVKKGIKPFGISSNAVKNGLMLIFGFVILLERMSMKFRWYYFFSLLLFVTAIYFTYTRNNYLTLFFALFIWYVISKKNKVKPNNFVWFLSLGFYVSVIIVAYYMAFIEGSGSFSIYVFTGESSVQTRVINWVVIFHDYFLKDIFSFNTFFGYGLTQFENDLSPEKTFWIIDNSILMVYLGSGLIGVFLFLSWLKSAFNVLNRNYLKCEGVECSHIKIIMVLLMVYLINGALNASILTYTFILPILLMLSKYTRMKSV
jgi:hypothetical protein